MLKEAFLQIHVSDLKWHLTFSGNGSPCFFKGRNRLKMYSDLYKSSQSVRRRRRGHSIPDKETLFWSGRSLNSRVHSAFKIPFLKYQQWHPDSYFNSVYSAKPDLAEGYLSILVLNIFKFNNPDCYWKRNKALPRILTMIGFIWCLWNRLQVYLSYLCVSQRLIWGSVEVCISN